MTFIANSLLKRMGVSMIVLDQLSKDNRLFLKELNLLNDKEGRNQ
jgi:hypothetical protein